MMCPECGYYIPDGVYQCSNCGCSFYNATQRKIEDNRRYIFIGVGFGLVILVLVFFAALFMNTIGEKYYFDTTSYSYRDVVKTTGETALSRNGKYSTIIISDNTYSGVRIRNKSDADDLIIDDSVSQKDSCPSEIRSIEDEIISKYKITAVNLCELDPIFAKELSKVFKNVYDNYPSVRGYITNLTLVNVKVSDNYIAAFMPVFSFATSNTKSTYPWVIKSQVLLNSSYFLNIKRLEESVKDSVSAAHFPENANIYSPVAHEMGHYLSFIALMKHYKMDSILLVDEKNINKFYKLYDDFGEGDFSYEMIKEAYDNYIKDTSDTISIEEFRGMISNYALAKDKSGEYIHDEAIAEAFHDVYLNGDNATIASKYIIDVLKKKLES